MKLLSVILMLLPLLFVYTIITLGGLLAVGLYVAYVVLAYVNFIMFKKGVQLWNR